MNKSVDIEFVEEERGYFLTFADGKKSPIYYSKQKGMDDCLLKRKKEGNLIEPIELEGVMNQIISARNIPFFESLLQKNIGLSLEDAFFDSDRSAICCKSGTCAHVPDLNDKEEVKSLLDTLVYTGDIDTDELNKLKEEFGLF
jgi:hypothetical protein